MIKAQIQQESSFDILAVSPDSPCGVPAGWTDAESKSFGLIQITPACGEATACRLSNGHPNLTTDMGSSLWPTSCFNPTMNLDQGVQSQVASWNDLKQTFSGCTAKQYILMAVGAYNSGEGAITGCGTWNSRAASYITSVLGHYADMAQRAGLPDPY